MSTLLLRLAGPMQAWGTDSRFEVRNAGSDPSKSGVLGLLCAALGRPRSEPLDDLAALRMGVRIDFPGVVMRDYQTAGGTHRAGDGYGVAKADGSGTAPLVSSRYYLSDADFLVGLSGPAGLLEGLHSALHHPVHQLCLGRKPFLPGAQVWLEDGLRQDQPLEDALRSVAWPRLDRSTPPPGRRPTHLTLVVETDPGWGQEARRDQPVGAAFATRRFELRFVTIQQLILGADVAIREA